MNLFFNPFLPEKTHTDDSVLFHVTPAPWTIDQSFVSVRLESTNQYV